MTLPQILRIINRLVNQYQQRTKSGDSSSSSTAPKGSKSLIKWGILAIIIITGAISSVFIVDATEQAIVLRLGKYIRTVGPGLQFKLPYTIERNYTVPTQIVQKKSFGFRTAEAGIVSFRDPNNYSNESTMLTGDLNIVNVEWIIQYKITDPKNWLFNVQNKDKTIYDISISVVNQLVGDYYITDVLGVAKTQIEEDALLLMNNFFQDYNLGVTVTAVRLQNVVPPEGEVQDAFEDVNKAEQDRNRLINEGKEAYNREIPKSRGQAEQLVELAKGYATERVNKAKGDVARFNAVLEEYQRSPTVTRNRIYYETIEELFNNLGTAEDNTQFLDGRFENLVPFLPLTNQQTITSPTQ